MTAPRSVWGREAASGSKNRLPRCASCERSRFDAMECKRISTRNSLEFAFVSRSLDLGLHESRADGFFFLSLLVFTLPEKTYNLLLYPFIYTIASRLVTHPHSFSFFFSFPRSKTTVQRQSPTRQTVRVNAALTLRSSKRKLRLPKHELFVKMACPRRKRECLEDLERLKKPFRAECNRKRRNKRLR